MNMEGYSILTPKAKSEELLINCWFIKLKLSFIGSYNICLE